MTARIQYQQEMTLREESVLLHWENLHHQSVCVNMCVCSELIDHQREESETELMSRTVFTSSLPFTHPGRWHATQLVTAWIRHGEGLGQRIRLEIQFCATSNSRKDPSDAA